MDPLLNENIPWVEKYRPTQFDNIVMDENNKKLFKNIIDKKYFPNLLFYGPPGTGKTTTIINLINEFQKGNTHSNRGSVIHLNASDERGIDIIRNQINMFVKSKGLFDSPYKFVILDEVDYMTKNAHQALKYLLQTTSSNVRFCLICNYISKIDELLQDEFICIRFNQLPRPAIHSFIKQISDNEGLGLSDNIINIIQNKYNSDIRSMINFIQLNRNLDDKENYIISNDTWEKIHNLLLTNNVKEDEIINYIHELSIQYNTDKKHIIQSYFNYVIINYQQFISYTYLNFVEKNIHNHDADINDFVAYFVYLSRKHYADYIHNSK